MNEISKDDENMSIGSRLMIHFRHLKKIFKDEEKQEAEKTTEVSLQNLEAWLNEKAKPLMEDVNQQSEEILMRISEELQRARINVEVLENAKLQNPNIPFRAKQYMEGNRKAYVRAVNSFLGHMEINNRDYFYLVGFCKQFDGMINELNKGTLRSYTILQEFFANETGRIAHNLKNFDALFSELKSALNDERIVSVNNAREKIHGMKAKISQKINADVDFRDMEASLKLANEEKNKIMADIEKFNASEAHSNFLKLNEEKKAKANAFYNDENSLLQAFSALERPLRKYSHIAFEHEEVILDYLKNPIETLANDKNLGIVNVLANLEKALKENQIQIDDKKREKAFEEIKKLSREFLEGFVKRYFSFKAEIGEIDNKIKATGVSEKFRNFNRQLEDVNLRIERSNEEFGILNNDVVRLGSSIESLKNEIESSVKGIFGEEIRVVV
ncbi:hypothetical protein J4204_00760 [Candidatus Woesearchaeota archaeon]|nr:hypothetical protein [Candidatus Woesearchaeota archaeon]